MIIKVLGTKGCKNCEDLYKKISNLINEKKYNVTLEKVTSIIDISKYKIINIPALVVDDKVLLEGVVPSNDDLINIIENSNIPSNIINESTCTNGSCRF